MEGPFFNKIIRLLGETKNGPVYSLIIKAKIVTPDITPSLDFADFGKVICG